MQIAVSGRVSLYREQVQFINPPSRSSGIPQATNLDQDELLPIYRQAGAYQRGHQPGHPPPCPR